jgi:hypothetical protein
VIELKRVLMVVEDRLRFRPSRCCAPRDTVLVSSASRPASACRRYLVVVAACR